MSWTSRSPCLMIGRAADRRCDPLRGCVESLLKFAGSVVKKV
ncbi:MAG: hypothetical protein P8J78_06225 [Maricaulis sp.]|nr:hypothetical protein [Maricaulis sp.]MDG2044188.1 hypothetical protein [Maricaulis sp.]